MSSHFRRISLANFFMFVSVYMLFPVLPVALMDQLDITITQIGYLFIAMIVGRIIAGPFVNYLVDVFKRKYLCITTLFIVLASIMLYPVVDTYQEALLLSLLEGLSFGVVSAALITLSIDICHSDSRNKCNSVLGWSTRLGMVIGIATGSFIYLNIGLLSTLIVSVFIGILAILLLFAVHVPFRAPIGSKLLSLDRFLLPRGWVLSINMILIAFVPGVLTPLIHYRVSNLFMFDGWSIPYFAIVAVGFAITFLLKKYLNKLENKTQMLIGLTLLVLSVSCFILLDILAGQILSGFMLGVSLGIITPVFLMMFVELSSHCERASANTTNLLSWGTGLALGLALSCYFKDDFSSLIAYQAAMFSAASALVYFILFSYPYYSRRKIR